MKLLSKGLLIFSSVLLILFLVLILPSGGFTPSTPPVLELATQILTDPDNFASDVWYVNSWSSSDAFQMEFPRNFSSSGEISIKVWGSDLAFHAVSVGQGYGSTVFQWGPTATRSPLYHHVNTTFYNIITFRAKIDDVTLTPFSPCVGIGVSTWWDAVTVDGRELPVEIYVFLRQEGVYALPLGSYKDVVRSDYNKTSGVMGLEWDYIYFHPWQVPVGEWFEARFELSDFTEQFRRHFRGDYLDADFYLTKVDGCIEVFMAEASMTVDFIGLESVAR